ncbi:MAG: hypothetical protein QNJ97_10975 [Myxococcota bacterium]|nr:hypothetical protein [Myxococcota bacterium]
MLPLEKEGFPMLPLEKEGVPMLPLEKGGWGDFDRAFTTSSTFADNPLL